MTDLDSPDTDAITAHLDRAWDLLSRGDFVGARISAGNIMRHDDQSPEGHCLLGAIAAGEGDPVEAVELFQQAMELAPEYPEPLLYAAELCIHSLQDADLGLQFCRDARALSLEPADRLEVELLCLEAHLGLEDRAGARQLIAGLSPDAPLEPSHRLRLGRALLQLEQPEQAEEALHAALGDPLTGAEAHYLTGLALEQQGQQQSARRHLVQSSLLERAAPPPPSLDQEQLQQLVRQALESLPPAARDWYRGVPLTMLEFPPAELVAEGLDPRCLALATGHPSEQQEGVTHLFIYRCNLERCGPDVDDVVEQLQLALLQELQDLLAGHDDPGQED